LSPADAISLVMKRSNMLTSIKIGGEQTVGNGTPNSPAKTRKSRRADQG
jgi:hypothetical protein